MIFVFRTSLYILVSLHYSFGFLYFSIIPLIFIKHNSNGAVWYREEEAEVSRALVSPSILNVPKYLISEQWNIRENYTVVRYSSSFYTFTL